MTAEQRLVDSGLRAWKLNADRMESFFHPLSEEQLEQEVAPGRNRLRYLWGHVAAVNDALFPLLGIGPRLHPALDAMFVANPDRPGPALLSGPELARASGEIDRALWSAFGRWSAAEWLAKHTAVSEEDFLREPHRNRFTVLLSRTAHTAFHYGQAILALPRP
jgi:hypothetical protein